jgi:hypothetical protein
VRLKKGAPDLTDAARKISFFEAPPLLEQGHALTGLRKPERGDGAAEAGANHQVVVSASHQRRVTSLW